MAGEAREPKEGPKRRDRLVKTWLTRLPIAPRCFPGEQARGGQEATLRAERFRKQPGDGSRGRRGRLVSSGLRGRRVSCVFVLAPGTVQAGQGLGWTTDLIEVASDDRRAAVGHPGFLWIRQADRFQQ